MKESARAIRHELAHNSCVGALKELAGDNAKVRELENLKGTRMPPAVASMMEMELMAGILEDLIQANATKEDEPDEPDEAPDTGKSRRRSAPVSK